MYYIYRDDRSLMLIVWLADVNRQVKTLNCRLDYSEASKGVTKVGYKVPEVYLFAAIC